MRLRSWPLTGRRRADRGPMGQTKEQRKVNLTICAVEMAGSGKYRNWEQIKFALCFDEGYLEARGWLHNRPRREWLNRLCREAQEALVLKISRDGARPICSRETKPGAWRRMRPSRACCASLEDYRISIRNGHRGNHHAIQAQIHGRAKNVSRLLLSRNACRD
jgi:hypothetical protein